MLFPAAALPHPSADPADVWAGKGGNEWELVLILKLAVLISASYEPQEQNQSLFAS